jgi:hypothetical protein
MKYGWKNTPVFDLIGKTIVSIVDDGDGLSFTLDDGSLYWMGHMQDCCESVYLEETIGSLDDLIGSPILEASEENSDAGEGIDGISMWTFYKFGTIKGHVTLRWLGSSNGYYSVAVDFRKSP